MNKLIKREFLPEKEETQKYINANGEKRTCTTMRKRWFATMECIRCKKEFTVKERTNNKHIDTPCEKCKYEIAAYNSFIKKALTKHKERFDYSLITSDNYINLFTPVNIICKKHGAFSQKPKDHTSNKNGKQCCPSCIQEFNKLHNKRSIESWKDELAEKTPHITFVKHGNSDSNMEKCTLKCNHHGEFETTLASIKNSVYVCHKCAIDNNAFDARLKRIDIKGTLYHIYIPSINLWKIGVTTKTLKERFRRLPFTYKIIWEHEYSTVKEAYEKEFFYLKQYRKYRMYTSPTNMLGEAKGSTELLTCTIPKLCPSTE